MRNNTDGRSLELFFVDGKPDGMLTAEVFNWTGQVLVQFRQTAQLQGASPVATFELVSQKKGEWDAIGCSSCDRAIRKWSNCMAAQGE